MTYQDVASNSFYLCRSPFLEESQVVKGAQSLTHPDHLINGYTPSFWDRSHKIGEENTSDLVEH